MSAADNAVASATIAHDARLVTIDPTTDERWELLTTGTRADIFHSAGWLRVLRDTYDLAIEARILVDGTGTPVAGIVYAQIVDIMDRRTVSLPFSDFCDPLVSTRDEWIAITADVIAEGERFHTKCLHSEFPSCDARLVETGWAYWHSVDLQRSTDEIWAAIDPSARRSVRKAQKTGVTVRAAETLDDVRAFFELHLRVRKVKYGLLAQPWRFFENIWHHLLSAGAGRLLLAEVGDELVGGVLFLEWNDTFYYKFNASDAGQLGVRPNDLLIWEGICLASSRALRTLDFGTSDWEQEGLVRFKRKYASDEKVIRSLQQMPTSAPTDREKQMRSLLPDLTRLFTGDDIPDDVTEQAGDTLYRYFT